MTTTASRLAHTDPSIRVVRAVADTLDTDPGELSPPLGEVLDTDALDRISQSNVATTFQYAGCLVTVTAGNEVQVRNATNSSL